MVGVEGVLEIFDGGIDVVLLTLLLGLLILSLLLELVVLELVDEELLGVHVVGDEFKISLDLINHSSLLTILGKVHWGGAVEWNLEGTS
jgi:hypothetical protein